MDFSQRMGFAPTQKIIQTDDIDHELRVALWNAVLIRYFNYYKRREGSAYAYVKGSNFAEFALTFQSDFLKKSVDMIPAKWEDYLKQIREFFFRCEWHRVYSLLEFIVFHAQERYLPGLIPQLNAVLQRENSAYRFVSGKVTPITSQQEIEEIERAIASSDQYAGARTHLQTSLGFLTDKLNPDYRNSIKESISAVESLAKKLVGDDKATLGQALKVLEKHHNLHPSLKTAFSALYGYTNDAGGIRHSLMENESELTNADARFMLICCSAFINFAIDSTKS